MEKSENTLMHLPTNLTNDDILSIFSRNIKLEDISISTVPSAIAVGDVSEIQLTKIPSSEIERYLWLHPAIPRGIQIKANRMTSRNYNVTATNGNEDAALYCHDILKNSGGIVTINQWIQDAMAFGDGYRTLVPDSGNTEILMISEEHPIYFDIARTTEKQEGDSEGGSKYTDLNYKISDKTKKPEAYTQLEWDKTSSEYKPIGKEIPANKVAHLIFDKWGDEVKGISLVQYVHLTIKYLLNMEEAAAETIWRNGFTQKKITTNIRTEKDLRKMATNVASMRSRDVIILPDGSDISNLVPGASEFPAYHNVFMELIAIRLGIPKSLLLMSGQDSNKSTLSKQIEDMRDDLANDELVIKHVIEEQIFKPACQLKFNEEFEDIPEFNFEPIRMDKDALIEQIKNTSTYVVQLVNSASVLSSMGKEDEAQKILDYLMKNLDENYTVDDAKSTTETKTKETKTNIDKKTTEKKDGTDAKQIPPETPRIPPASKELKAGDNTKS